MKLSVGEVGVVICSGASVGLYIRASYQNKVYDDVIVLTVSISIETVVSKPISYPLILLSSIVGGKERAMATES